MLKTKSKFKACFPHMGNYHVAFKTIAELLDCEIITPPPISKKTIELGFKYSPEFVCIPFKYNLGNYIESLEKGANVIVQAGGGCRFGFYGEVQKEILKSLGYKFEFFKLNNSFNPFVIAKEFQKFNPKATIPFLLRGFTIAFCQALAIEKIEDFVRKNIGFEKNKGEMEKLFKEFLAELDKAKSFIKIYKVYKKYKTDFRMIKTKKPKKPLRVGLVGELYVVMEPFSNFDIEKNLGKKGVEIHRFTTVSQIITSFLFSRRHVKHLMHDAEPYLKYHIGGHGLESVANAHKLAREGFDGLIHVKPFGCMPEINAMTALHRISQDYKFPIVYFSFDSLTSESGVNTRLEAFYDMLVMKRKKYAKNQRIHGSGHRLHFHQSRSN